MQQFLVGARKPLFFMHIPKTAGTSMRRYLADQYAAGQTCPARNWNDLLPISNQLDKYALVQGHFHVGLKGALGARQSLTLLRNPLNRTLSALRHLKRDPNFHPFHHRAKDMTIADMLSDQKIFDMHKNGQTGYLSANSDAQAIFSYLRAGADKQEHRDPADIDPPPNLETAKANLRSFDFVGICEDLKNLFPSFCEDMAYHPVVSFQTDNNAPDGVSDYDKLTSREIDLLRACNDLDLQLYDYALQLISERRENRSPSDWSVQSAVSRLSAQGTYTIPGGDFAIDLAGPVPGSSWYEPELNGSGCSRWTGPFRQFSLELPLVANGQYRVTLKFLSRRPIVSSEFTVTANDTILAKKLTGDQNIYQAVFDIPQFLLRDENGFCQLVIELPSVFRPKDEGQPDERTLGVFVNSIQFERLN